MSAYLFRSMQVEQRPVVDRPLIAGRWWVLSRLVHGSGTAVASKGSRQLDMPSGYEPFTEREVSSSTVEQADTIGCKRRESHAERRDMTCRRPAQQ